jgi:hypothetical protein
MFCLEAPRGLVRRGEPKSNEGKISPRGVFSNVKVLPQCRVEIVEDSKGACAGREPGVDRRSTRVWGRVFHDCHCHFSLKKPNRYVMTF